jgi:hypothetical protein
MIELLVFTPLPPKSINPVGFEENTRFSSGTIDFIASIEFVEREDGQIGPVATALNEDERPVGRSREVLRGWDSNPQPFD